MGKVWKFQDAKNHFSEVVEKAIHEGPQFVSRRGVEAVVVISVKDFKERTKPTTSLVDFFQNSPLFGVELELERKNDLS